MLLFKKAKFVLLFTVFFLIFPIVAGAVNFNQTITLKEDGSGSINILYLEKESTIKSKNFLIGNLPFTKEKINEYFGSSKTKIFESTISANSKDNTITEVYVSLTFSSVSDLNSLKGLVNNQFSFSVSDSGNVFKSSISPEFITLNSINQIYCVLNSKADIVSSNGQVKEKSVTWFRAKEYLNKNTTNFVATIFSKNIKKTASQNIEQEKGKSCGLFGIELPIVFLFGTVLMNYRRKRK